MVIVLLFSENKMAKLILIVEMINVKKIRQ